MWFTWERYEIKMLQMHNYYSYDANISCISNISTHWVHLEILYNVTLSCNCDFKGVFTPVLFGSIKSNSSSFSPLVWIFWAVVNTAIALGCGPNKRTKTQLKRWSRSASKRTLVQLIGWTNEWMTSSTCVVLITVSGSLAKRAVWKQTTPNKKNNNIIFGRDQNKWTSRLSWCEYTLSVTKS